MDEYISPQKKTRSKKPYDAVGAARQKRNRRKADGLCLCCDAPLLPGFIRCAECQEKYRQYRRTYYRKYESERHRMRVQQGICYRCTRPKVEGKTYCEKHRQMDKNERRRLFEEVLFHYGDKCECCGETRREFLTLDHINGDGAIHRRQTKGGTMRDIKQRNFPPGFRVLCMNCNWTRGVQKYCPHDKERELAVSFEVAANDCVAACLGLRK
jgi:hypothetical protein